MADVRADPVLVARLANANLAAAKQIADGHGRERPRLALTRRVFGSTSGATQFAERAGLAYDDLVQALGELVAVFENDMDKLHQTAAAYKKANDDEARRAGRLVP